MFYFVIFFKQINMPQIQQSTSQQQHDPLHPQQLVQVFPFCLFTIYNDTSHRYFLFFPLPIIYKLEVFICMIFLHVMTVYLLYYRITARGKGPQLQDLPIVLVQETHLALLILNHQLHLLILQVMEHLWRVTCRILLVFPKV